MMIYGFPVCATKHTTWWYLDMEALYILLAFVRGIHQCMVDSPQKGTVKMNFEFYCCYPEQVIKQTELQVIRSAMSSWILCVASFVSFVLIHQNSTQSKYLLHWSINRAQHILLSDGLAQVKWSVRQVTYFLLNFISMCQCKQDITPLLTHWSYVFLTLTHR